MTQSTRATRRGVYLLGSLLMVAGLVLGVYAIGLAIGSLISAAADRDSRPPVAVPSQVASRLEHGSYLIMQRTGRIDIYGNRIDLTPVTISPDQVTVRPAGAGAPIAVYPADNAYDDRDGISYTSAVSFTVPRAGSYQISVAGPVGGSYLLVRALAPVFHATAGPLRATALGGTLFLAGLVTVIAGLARSRPDRPAPSQPYWDGSRWRR